MLMAGAPVSKGCLFMLLSSENKTVTQTKSEPIEQKKLRAKRSQPIFGFLHPVTVPIHVNQKGLVR